MNWIGWLRDHGRWQPAVTGPTVEETHLALLAEAKRRGLPLTTGIRLITRGGGKGEPARPTEGEK